MSDSSWSHTSVILAFTVAASSGCGGGGLGAPAEVSNPLAASRFAPAERLDVSGGYAGTVKDSVYGSGEAYGELAQYQDAVGGNLTFIFASLPYITPVSFLLKGRSLTGSGVLGNTASALCPTSVTATYSSSRHLNGSYAVTNGCSSNMGTFRMKQTCTYGEGAALNLNARLKRC